MNKKIYYEKWLKTAPINMNAGLTVIEQIKNKNDYIVFIGFNNHNGIKRFEFFGGKYDISDKTALHTATREFTEELFNYKLSQDQIDTLVYNLIINNHLIDELTYITKSASYFINLNTFKYIYNFIKYNKYDIITHIDYNQFIKTRNDNFILGIPAINNKNYLNGDPSNEGLYEIEKISMIYLSKAYSLNMRKFMFNILSHLKIKLNIV